MDCTKELSLNTASPPIVYYDFQTLANGDTEVVDLINGANLTGAGLTVGPGFIGNGWNSPNQATRTGDPIFDLSDTDFTIRFWVKSLASIPYSLWLHSYDNTGGTGTWNFAKNFANPDDIVFIVTTAFPDFYTVVTPGFPTGQWHYILATYEPGIRIGIRLDGGTPSFVAIPGPIANTLDSLQFRDTAGVVEFDEVAIWDRLLSEDEITADYNGGAGRTWPW